MPNPYDDIFDKGEEEHASSFELDQTDSNALEEEEDERFVLPDKEPLDVILEKIQIFQSKVESFSAFLSHTSAIDHKTNNGFLQLFLIDSSDISHDKQSLHGERDYHDLLCEKFRGIIIPMRELAVIHVETIEYFNTHIDADYFSSEKTDVDVKSEISLAIKGITIQRKILDSAANDLKLLKGGIEGTERRLKRYINAGGANNISRAELEVISQKSFTLTKGIAHQFDYTVFDMNVLDKTAIFFGVYMKETTSQYLRKLRKAFDVVY